MFIFKLNLSRSLLLVRYTCILDAFICLDDYQYSITRSDVFAYLGKPKIDILYKFVFTFLAAFVDDLLKKLSSRSPCKLVIELVN